MIFSTPLGQAQAVMRRTEGQLLSTLRTVTGFRNTAEALAFVYRMKTDFPVLHNEDPTTARANSVPDVEKYFVTTSLVDVLVSLQFQNKIALENLKTALK